jgi:hypothetical protein
VLRLVHEANTKVGTYLGKRHTTYRVPWDTEKCVLPNLFRPGDGKDGICTKNTMGMRRWVLNLSFYFWF